MSRLDFGPVDVSLWCKPLHRKELRLVYSVRMLCRVLKVRSGGYYAWLKRPACTGERDEKRSALERRAAHKQARQTYSPERPRQDLADNGIAVCVHRIKLYLAGLKDLFTGEVVGYAMGERMTKNLVILWISSITMSPVRSSKAS